ncbi:MAG: hypothetical protein KDD58_03940, partial [Bdellovibrionales bacterium]|nr:hypothetical protein [Bdellovibrionales bacterium]
MWIVFLLFLIFPNSIYDEQIGTQLIMWDVGQGQWVTINTYPYCLHFDAGGEYAPLKKIYKLCRQRKNIIFLSHGDWDHINKLSFFKKRNLDYCLFNYPLENLNLYKKNFLNSFIFCKETVIKNLKIFTPS